MSDTLLHVTLPPQQGLQVEAFCTVTPSVGQGISIAVRAKDASGQWRKP